MCQRRGMMCLAMATRERLKSSAPDGLHVKARLELNRMNLSIGMMKQFLIFSVGRALRSSGEINLRPRGFALKMKGSRVRNHACEPPVGCHSRAMHAPQRGCAAQFLIFSVGRSDPRVKSIYRPRVLPPAVDILICTVIAWGFDQLG